MRISVAAAVKNLTINDVVHLDNLIPKDKVDLLISGAKFDRLIETAKTKNEFYKMKQEDEYYEAFTPAGLPLVFACIDNEPRDQEASWQFEQLFKDLLEKKLNPNQIN
jgi:hypothetical protein